MWVTFWLQVHGDHRFSLSFQLRLSRFRLQKLCSPGGSFLTDLLEFARTGLRIELILRRTLWVVLYITSQYQGPVDDGSVAEKNTSWWLHDHYSFADLLMILTSSTDLLLRILEDVAHGGRFRCFRPNTRSVRDRRNGQGWWVTGVVGMDCMDCRGAVSRCFKRTCLSDHDHARYDSLYQDCHCEVPELSVHSDSLTWKRKMGP